MAVDPQGSACEKAAAIFRELAGERASEISGFHLSIRTRDATATALADVYGDDTADKLGGHMSDWNGDVW